MQSTYGGSGNSTLAFSTSTTRSAGATGNFVVSGGTNGSTNKITLTGPAANAFINKGLFFGGSKYAYYDTAGYVRGMNYDGVDVDTEVTDTITASKHVQLTASPAARAGDTLLSLNLDGGAVDYTMNSDSLIVPAILKSGGGALSTISGGTSVTTASNAELVIRTDTASDLLTISSAVTGFSGGLTKTGAGTLTLSGGNGYTGTTSINAGTLVVSGGSAIADGSAVNLSNSAGATFQLNSSETIGSLAGGGFSGGNVDVGANTLTLAGTSTFGGKLIGSGGVTVSAGTLTLSNKNTFAGTITLNGTSQLTLSYGNDGTTSTPTASSGGTINMAGGTSILFSPTAQLTNGVTLAPGGSTSVGVFYSNPIVVTSGTAIVKQGTDLTKRFVFSGGVTGGTSGSQTLSILQGFSGGNAERTTITFSGVIQDGSGGPLGVSADFQNANSINQGAFISLSGRNTFTGPIVVNNTKGLTYTPGVGNPYLGAWFVIGGEITSGFSDRTITPGTGALGWNGTFGNYSGTISLATGTILNYMSSANQTLAGVISGGGNILKEGSGTLTLTGANTYTGRTTVSAGTLSINSIQNVSSTTDNALGKPTTAANGLIPIGNASTTGTLIYTGGVQSTDRTIQIGFNSGTPAAGDTGGAIIQNDGSGLLTFSATTFNTPTNAASGTSPTRTLTLQGSNDGNISGIIQNNQIASAFTAAVALTKSGAGTWTLSNTNTFTGGTTVSAGKLVLTGNNTLSPTTGSLSIGAATLQLQANGGNTVGVISSALGYATGSATGNASPGLTTTGTATFELRSDTSVTFAGTSGIGGISGRTLNIDVANNGSGSGNAITFSPNGNVYGGSNTVNITGSNGYSLILGDWNSNGTGGTLTFNPTTANVTVGNLAANTGTPARTVALDGTASNNLIGGISSVNYTLTKSNTSTWVMNGASTYSVATNVIQGSLGIGNDSAFGTSTLNIGGTNSNTPTIFASGGTRTIANNIVLLATSLGGNPTIAGANDLTMNGTVTASGATRTLSVNNSGLTTLAGNVYLSNDDTTAGRGLTINGTGNTIISGVIANNNLGNTVAATLTKSDSNTLTLTGTNTYTGATTVSAGRLVINGNQSAATGVVTVASGGTLAGNGSIGGAVVVNGTLAPGNSPDFQTYNSGITFNTGSTFEVEVLGANVGNGVTGYDSAVITAGNVFIDSGVTLSLPTPGGSGYMLGSNLWIIDNDDSLGTLTGTFAGLPDGTQVTALDGLGGFNWQIRYGADQLSNSLSGGNDVALNAFQAIPEPSTLVLGGLALLGFAGAGLRRRRLAKQ